MSWSSTTDRNPAIGGVEAITFRGTWGDSRPEELLRQEAASAAHKLLGDKFKQGAHIRLTLLDPVERSEGGDGRARVMLQERSVCERDGIATRAGQVVWLDRALVYLSGWRPAGHSSRRSHGRSASR